MPPESSTFTTTTGENAAPDATLVGCVVNANFVAAPTVTLNVLLVAEVNPLLAAVNENPLPANADTVNVVNVATPLTAVALAFVSAPLPVANVNVTGATEVGITLPPESSTFTTTTGANTAPDATFDGCVANASFAALPTVTLNVLLVAEVNPLLAAVNENPLPANAATLNPVNVATPLVAVAVAFASVPVPVASVNPTDALDVATVFPPLSSTVTTTTGENAAPEPTVDGCVVNASFAAGPTVTLNGLLVADVNPLLAAVNENPLPANADTVNVVNVATPLTAATVAFASAPTPVANVIPIDALDVGTTFPPASSTFTTTTGENAAPDPTFVGCVVNTRLFAGPTATANGLLVAAASAPLVAVSVYPLPAAAATDIALNVATPLAATTVSPLTTPLGDTVNVTVAFENTIFPLASSTCTTTAGLIATPACTVVGGCVVNTSFVATPLEIANNPLVAGASVPFKSEAVNE